MDTIVTATATFGDDVIIEITENPADPDILVEAQAQRLSTLPPLFRLKLDVTSKE
ncbi:hypothetical protein [Vallitalea okinawensis]|uniref:hypothetical protein n=1 Tax=Vallitalea okinawensis TaxID=2078660 RepID=UPI001300B701|nr:hypothetical protein [Vallitalea okinawensis]